MTKLAIRGHATRGNEVIQLLEMLGGWNIYKCLGNRKDLIYYITSDIYNSIDNDTESNTNSYKSFSLEEFLEKFPYKVGNKVIVDKNVEIINRMRWDDNEIVYGFFTIHDLGELTADMIQPYKEETMEDTNEKPVNHVYDTDIISFDIAQKDKYELDLQGKFEIKLREGKYFVERIKPKYPTTYEECCDIMGIDVSRTIEHDDCPFYKDVTCYEHDLLSSLVHLRKLIICRDAYWKIAGEQMGLGKPWEPVWTESNPKYTISVVENELVKTGFALTQNYILAFPTEEMRDMFYNNFKDMIEQCKELL